MRIKLDSVQFCSEIDTYLNYDVLTDNMSVSGSLGNGSTRTYSVTIPYSNPRTRADVYGTNNNTGMKVKLGSPRITPYQFVSSEIASTRVIYNGKNIEVVLEITNNTGGTITLPTQTIKIDVVLIEVPIT